MVTGSGHDDEWGAGENKEKQWHERTRNGTGGEQVNVNDVQKEDNECSSEGCIKNMTCLDVDDRRLIG